MLADFVRMSSRVITAAIVREISRSRHQAKSVAHSLSALPCAAVNCGASPAQANDTSREARARQQKSATPQR